MKHRIAWILAGLVAGFVFSAMATPVENDFLLQTKNSTMAFHKSDNTWLMVHYGSKIDKSSDANALAWSGWVGGNFFGHRTSCAIAAVIEN